MLAVASGAERPDGTYNSDSELEKYVWLNARTLPLNRRTSENVVWLWLYTLMAVNSDADITRLRGTEKQLPKGIVLKMAIDLGQYLLSVVENDDGERNPDSLDSTRNMVQRSWSCINILAQLHAIGTGTGDSISPSDADNVTLPLEWRELLSDSTAFLAGESSSDS